MSLSSLLTLERNLTNDAAKYNLLALFIWGNEQQIGSKSRTVLHPNSGEVFHQKSGLNRDSYKHRLQ